MEPSRRLPAWSLVAALVLSACEGVEPGGLLPGDASPEARPELGRLAARPDPAASETERRGIREVPAGSWGDLLLVPDGYCPGEPMPFAVTLHGCCGEARAGLALWRDLAQEHGIILLAPNGGTQWSFGEPVARIDEAMAWVFERYAVDPDRLAIVGFSAGASFSLALGLANGDLFSHVVAFAPGGVPEVPREGEPPIFVSHGTEDQSIPIERGGRPAAAELRDEGYDVRYVEYDGGHRPPDRVFSRSVRWFLDGAPDGG